MSVTISESESSEETILPAAGSIRYMLVDGEKDGDAIAAISERHWRTGPVLFSRPQKHIVPIVLDERLRLRPSQILFDCRSRIEDRSEIFARLNSAATFAMERWTDRATASVNVFSEAYCVHKKALLRLKHRREELTRGTPLSVSETEEEGGLFKQIRKPTLPLGTIL